MAFLEGVQARQIRNQNALAAEQQNLQERELRLKQFTTQTDELNKAMNDLIAEAVKFKEKGGEVASPVFRQTFTDSALVLASLRRNFFGGTKQSVDDEVNRLVSRFDATLEGTQTPNQKAQTEGKANVAGVQATAQALTQAGRPTTLSETAQAAGILSEPEFASPIGKLIADRQLAVEQFGPDSRQVVILDGAIDAEQNPDPSITDSTSVFKEYSRQSADFVVTSANLKKAIASAQQNTGAGDIALVFSFFKANDPGSRVTEGETATVDQVRGVDQRIIGIYNGLISGESLTPTLREEFVRAIAVQYIADAEIHIARRGVFENLARGLGLDPSLVVQDPIDPTLIQEARQLKNGRLSFSDAPLPKRDEEILAKPLDQISPQEARELSPAGEALLRQRLREARGG